MREVIDENFRCKITNNCCGTDTEMVGRPCQCDSCKAWRLEYAKELDALSKEAMDQLWSEPFE